MRKHTYFLVNILAAVVLLANSCSKQPDKINPEFAAYISAFTSGHISPESAIDIELVHDLPSVALNDEVADKLFSFSPNVKGKTFWVNAHTVRFVPDENELKPGKMYSASFRLDKVLKVGPKFKSFNFNFAVNEQNFTFTSMPYSPMSASNQEWNSVEGTLKLVNRASPDDIAKMFELKGSKAAKVNVRNVSGNTYLVSIDSLQRTGRVQDIDVVVNGKPIGAGKKESFSIFLPKLPEEEFVVIDARILDESTPQIRVTFSSSLSQNQNIEGLISPSGVDNYTYQIEKNVLKIYPETYPQSDVTLQIHPGIKSIDNLALRNAVTYQLTVEKEKPEIKMEKSGNILPNSNELILPFSAVNLWAVDVKVIKIYQNNILHFLQGNSLANNSANEVRRFGRLIKKEQIRLDSDKSLNLSQWNRFSIDLAPMISDDPGAIYIVQLSMKQDYSLYQCGGSAASIPSPSSLRSFKSRAISEEDDAVWDEASPYYYEPMNWSEYNWEDIDNPCKPTYYMNRNRIMETTVMASNMGIIAKSGADNKIDVVVTDILTASPTRGADVTVYNYQMQVIGKGKTDARGFADIEYKGGKPFVVTAANGSDIGYLEVEENYALSLSNFDVDGREVKKGLKGYIYGERGVWRPGDTIFLSFVFEDKLNNLPKDHPVALEVYTPQGQLFNRQVKSEGVNGFYTFEVTTDALSPTGLWQSYVKVGGASFFKSLRIETIKPNRLKVRLETDSLIDASRGMFSGTLTAQWLHGAPASNMKADVELSLSRSEIPFAGFSRYVFNNPLYKFETESHKIFEGNLNASGVVGINTKIPVAETAPGMLKANILSRVYEAGGDMSFYAQTAFYSPYAAYVGVKSPQTAPYEFLETNSALPFDVVTLDARGKKINRSNLEYKVYKLNWSWWWNSNNESLNSYINNTAVSPVESGVVSTVNGEARINIQIDYPEWGRYMILVKDKDGGHTTGTVFYVDWPSSYGKSNKVDPSGLTMLSFSTDKQSYEVGETAVVYIPKSSQGNALVSIETGSKIISKEWVKTSADAETEYRFKITEEMSPNLYLFVTLLQPHAQSDNDLPIRLYGVRNISVNNKQSILEPVINMPDELSPEKEFTISVSERNRKAMTYTMAIVDEGLLDLTSFKSPNAWNEFYSRESLGVRTWDLFDRVLSANTGMFGPLLSIGGDEMLKASSDKVNRFKPIVKFIGPLTIKAGETKSTKITLPSYVGSLRVMVVAGGDGAYGSAEKTVAVKNALMTLSTLPRVVGPGEEVWLPVNVFAMDKKVKDVRVSVETNGLLKPVDESSKSVTFDKEGDQIVYFKLKAGADIGAEQVRIKTTGGGETVTETIDIGIRNPNPPIVIGETDIIDAGQSAVLELNPGIVNPNDWAKLEVSRFPTINLNKNLSFLADYPHSCTEQVVSQGFPLLYIGSLIKQTDEEKEKTNNKIASVIQTVISRQHSDGGFVYWSGQTHSSEWVSTYAGHFLTEAKNKGFDVPQIAINRWVQYQQKLSKNWSHTQPYSGYYSISMTELQQAYRLYALALSGNAEQGSMNRMREISNLNLQARWQLAAAYAVSGKKDVANSIIFNVGDEVGEYSFNNDTYGSPARDKAMIMHTCLLLGDIEKAMKLAEDVAKELSGSYVTTQTASFGLMAMAQLAEKMGTGNIDVEWSLNDKPQDKISTPQSYHQADIAPAQSIVATVSNKGSSKIYARLTAYTQPLVDTLQAKEGALKLSVAYTNLAGQPIDVKNLKQGAEFVATVTVRNSIDESLSDLALVQIFPSGWEIFNERVVGGGESSQSYNYRDIRDDRVLTYFNLAAGRTKTFRIRLQAAYRGSYFLPAVSCQAMYAPSEQARTKGIWVDVVE